MRTLVRILAPALFLGAAWAADSNSVLIRNVTVHTITGADISNGSVLVIDGKIAEVGQKLGGRAGARIVDGHGLQLYPGLINAATNVGLSEIEALRDTVDTDEIGEFDPQLRAEIAFNPSSEHIPVTRAGGITTVVVLPSSGERPRRGEGNLIAGQAALMHLSGWTWEEMAVRPSVVMELLFPQIETRPAGFAALLGGKPPSFADQEKVYREQLRQMSEFLEDARRYQKAKVVSAPDFRSDLRLESMQGVIDGKQALFIHAAHERQIKDAVDFADKEKVKIIIADPKEIGGTGSLLKQHNIPVVLGKVLALPEHNDDAYDAAYTLPNDFFKAGVKICFGTFDVEFARNVAFEAAQAVAFGLPKTEALKAITVNSAEILGEGAQLGSIEKGKLGDFILTDGDPMEARTNIKQMFIGGQEVSLESRHTREYEHWMKRN